MLKWVLIDGGECKGGGRRRKRERKKERYREKKRER